MSYQSEDPRIPDESPADMPSPAPAASSPEARPSRPAVPAANADARIQGGSIRLFRVWGIDVFLHWSWIFFALLRLQPSGGSDGGFDFAHYSSQIWYMVEYLALFGIVLLHEFGHALACRSVGGTANRIILWPLGGIAFVEPPPRPGAFLWSIAAGPLVNVLLLGPTIGFWCISRAAGLQTSAPNLYQFAVGLAWMNGYLLLFNMLPVYPLDGGQILQGLLWFILGRARSLLVAAAIGLVGALGLLAFAIASRSVLWGVMAGFGLLFSLVGVQAARTLSRMLEAPRREGAACPACGAAPPRGKFWNCPRCAAPADVFAAGGICPRCSTPFTGIFCAACGRTRPYAEWQIETVPSEPAKEEHPPVPVRTEPKLPPPAASPRPPTVTQRIVWGMIFGLWALACCGLPNVDKQPLGLIIWAIGGALFGAAYAGGLTRTWNSGQQRKKLRGTWRLVEVDGHDISADAAQRCLLVLKGSQFTESSGDQEPSEGTWWIDLSTELPAITLSAKTASGSAEPRQGIYRLNGKTLTICLAYPGQPRPDAFRAQADVQQVLIYRRAGKRRT
jgi:uncharacterized protein (TIGR03067 family)